LKDKEVRQLLKEFVEKYPSVERSLRSAENFEELSVDKSSVFFVDGAPLILRTMGGLLPSLRFDELIDTLPKIVVDMGAVAHVVNGAQIMRPGIRQFSNDFAKGDLVVIVDEKFGKKIALGLAETDSRAMKSLGKGRVITNLHYVGDELWKSFTP
jgi:malignant T-cell-amplified sequence